MAIEAENHIVLDAMNKNKGNTMSKTMLLYKDVVALSRADHKNLKLKPLKDLDFANHLNWTPVAGAEFYQLTRYYPIIFIQNDQADKQSEVFPVALLGLDPEKNEYIDNKNQWRLNTYIPAFIRRYPFVLANASEKENEFTVCFDASCNGLNEAEGEPLFDKEGLNTPMLDEIIQFMNNFNEEMKRTNEFVQLLKSYDLLEVRSAEIKSVKGSVFQLQDFLVINEEKVANLLSYQIAEFQKKGFLGWIYAHLISLGNLTDLLEEHIKLNPHKKTSSH